MAGFNKQLMAAEDKGYQRGFKDASDIAAADVTKIIPTARLQVVYNQGYNARKKEEHQADKPVPYHGYVS